MKQTFYHTHVWAQACDESLRASRERRHEAERYPVAWEMWAVVLTCLLMVFLGIALRWA